ncbi:hypothetical protein [Thermomonospora umbrina]|uniref:Uncharacterized protein n=1 Tax=Thermomonospora umbrina TaxID=111806 RepID=A0A3D9SXZ5_9ACTN|nr:hypothetical protein [Thermomonospora umbrina]REF00843.1 hypothetical protein DFJ69_6437 [Thermomonospora umbrina]
MPDPGYFAAQEAQRRFNDQVADHQRARRRAGKSNGYGFSTLLLVAGGAYVYYRQPELWNTIESHVRVFLDRLEN